MDHAAALALIGPFEGRVEHMYLDTEGLVTVGIGNMLPNTSTALALRWAWRDPDDREKRDEPNQFDVAADFRRVTGAVPGLRADSYRPLTRLVLLDAEIDKLFGRRVDEFVKRLTFLFPLYRGWPMPAQLATLDMIFQLGAGAFSFGHRKFWPKLTAALKALDFRAAAEHSHRPKSRDERNAQIRALFLEAAAA